MSAAATAPGKVILLGEHAVVRGQPCLSVALDRGLEVGLEPAASTRINHEAPDPHRHSYLLRGLELLRAPACEVRTNSDLPSASGLGSSAALCVALVGAWQRLHAGTLDPARAAQLAFEIELATQGAASPNDTTVAAAGGAVLLSQAAEPMGVPLWRVGRDERTWTARRLRFAPLPLVVANTGGRARTGEMVARVRHLMETRAELRGAFDEMGSIAREGALCYERQDWVGLGQCMEANAAWLARLGLETPPVARALAALRQAPGTLGAKLTGAGGGGCVVALTDRPEAARKAIEAAGALWVPVRPGARGLEASR